MGVRDGFGTGGVNAPASSGGSGIRGGYKPTAQSEPAEPTAIERKVLNSFNTLPDRERNSTLNRLRAAAQRGDAGAKRKIDLLTTHASAAPKDENYGPKSTFGQAVNGIANDFTKMAIDPFVGGSAGGDESVLRNPRTGTVTDKNPLFEGPTGSAASQRDIAIKGVEARLMYGKVPGTGKLPVALGGGVRNGGGALVETVKGADMVAAKGAANASRAARVGNYLKDTAKVANRVGANNAGASAISSVTTDNIDSVTGNNFGDTVANIGKQAAVGYAGGAAFGVGGRLLGSAARGTAGKITEGATHLKAAKMAADAGKHDTPFQESIKGIADEHGFIHIPGPTKTAGRIKEKALNDYGGKVHQVRDSVRATLSVHDPAHIDKAIETIGAKHEITRVKNGMDNTGYKDVKVNVKLPNGKEGEIQLTTPEMLHAKYELGGHKLYTQARVTEDAAKLEELNAQQNKLYAEAHAKTQARLSGAGDSTISGTSRPSTKATAGEKGLPVDTTVPRTVLPSESSRTTLSSISKKRVPGVVNDLANDESPITSTIAQNAEKGKTKPVSANREVTNTLAQELADHLRSIDKEVGGVQLVPGEAGGKIRASTNSPFYREVYKRTGKPPTKADYLEEAHRQLAKGTSPEAQMYQATIAEARAAKTEAKGVKAGYEADQKVNTATPDTPPASVAQSHSTDMAAPERPAHQAAIEEALRNNDMAKIAKIINDIPESDPYKKSMEKLFADRLPAPPQRIANDLPAAEPTGSKERKFITSVKDSPEVSQGTKDLVKGSYDPISNKQSIAAADARIAASEGAARDYVLNARKPTAEHTTTAIRLIDKFDQEGRHYEAAEITEHIAKKLTEAGQAVQAASILGRLSPEGIGIYAERQITKINQKRAEGLFGRWSKDVKLSPEDSASLREMARNIQKLEGPAKLEAQQELQSMLQSFIPATIGRKVATIQTIGQLLNPKTLLRNAIGNEIFYRTERLNKIFVATPIDIMRSKMTGSERTVTFHTNGQGKYWSAFLTGAKAGWKGVSPDGIDTQFDLQGAAFTGKWNPVTYLEKSLGATLRGFDYAAYKRSAGQTVGEMAELSAINKGLTGAAKKAHIDDYVAKVPKNILDIADNYGKYMTFQDVNLLSKGFTATKRGLNVGKDFGLGDLILKYPKTPANLIARGLEYSPAGFLRGAYLIAKPYLTRGKVDPAEVTLAVSRAITGSLGFTGLGYFLASQGVITGRASKDKDVNALQKQTGDGSYRINMTALRRWVFSGFNPKAAAKQEGDYFASYDWAQPVAMAISIGANANQAVNKQDNLNPFKAAAASIGDGVQTVADQPLVAGLRNFVGGTDFTTSMTRVATSAPASFVPTLSNQIRQITDPQQREAYTGTPLQQAIDQVVNKIPGQSQKLAPKSDTLGHTLKTVDGNGAERVFNAFFNPAITQRYNLSPSAKLVVDIYDRTGDTRQVPRMIDKTITIDGKSRKLSAAEYSAMQQFVGGATDDSFKRLNESEEFNSLSDNDKILVMSRVMTLIGQDAKAKMFGASSEKSTEQKLIDAANSRARSRTVKTVRP